MRKNIKKFPRVGEDFGDLRISGFQISGFQDFRFQIAAASRHREERSDPGSQDFKISRFYCLLGLLFGFAAGVPEVGNMDGVSLKVIDNLVQPIDDKTPIFDGTISK